MDLPIIPFKIGMDTAIESQFFRQQKHFKIDTLMRFAKICRVEKIIRPYLEALL